MELQPYTATSEMVAAAKMELSVLNPQYEQVFLNYVPKFQSLLKENYGLYISEDTELQNIGLADRIIVTSQMGLTQVRNLWAPASEKKDQKGMRTEGLHLHLPI